jgi:deoxyribodipyrimidine photolyase-related protein
MATFADGGVTATKRYVSGPAYINRMSDYCKRCRYDPAKSTGEGSSPHRALLVIPGTGQRSTQWESTPGDALCEAAERKAQRERAGIAIEELERVPRPDYEPAGKQ